MMTSRFAPDRDRSDETSAVDVARWVPQKQTTTLEIARECGTSLIGYSDTALKIFVRQPVIRQNHL